MVDALKQAINEKNTASILVGLFQTGDGDGSSDEAGPMDVDPEVEVSLGKALLGFLAAATAEEDSELANTLSGLSSIRSTLHGRTTLWMNERDTQSNICCAGHRILV